MQNINGPAVSEPNLPPYEEINPIGFPPPDYIESQLAYSQLVQYPPAYINPQCNQTQTNQVVNVNNSTVSNETTCLLQRPPSHICLALFSCLFCFWPLGCYALCNACEYQGTKEGQLLKTFYTFRLLVDNAFMEGDYNRSLIASVKAKTYAIFAIRLGIILLSLTAVLIKAFQ